MPSHACTAAHKRTCACLLPPQDASLQPNHLLWRAGSLQDKNVSVFSHKQAHLTTGVHIEASGNGVLHQAPRRQPRLQFQAHKRVSIAARPPATCM